MGYSQLLCCYDFFFMNRDIMMSRRRKVNHLKSEGFSTYFRRSAARYALPPTPKGDKSLGYQVHSIGILHVRRTTLRQSKKHGRAHDKQGTVVVHIVRHIVIHTC